MLTQFLATLKKHQLDFTAEEVADLLWLAHSFDLGDDEETPPPKASSSSAKKPTVETARPKTDPSLSEQKQEPEESHQLTSTPSPPSPPDLTLHASTSSPPTTEVETQPETKGGRLIPLPTPKPPALGHGLALERSLRPLMQRIPSRVEKELDIEATIEQIVEAKLWAPILRPTLERWLEVALVVDTTISMEIWQDVVTELHKLLIRHGAFRVVQRWHFKLTPEGELRLYLPTNPAIGRHYKELNDPTGRRLVLVVSDCVSPLWDQTTITTWLREWGQKGSVTLIQLMPPPLWSRTGLTRFKTVQLWAKEMGTTNQQLQQRFPFAFAWRGQETDKRFNRPSGMGLPVVTLEKQNLHEWARAMAGEQRLWLPGVLLPSLDNPVTSEEATPNNSVETTETTPLSLAERLDYFRGTASPTAWQLIGYLAAAPLTLPVMRLVQEQMLPHSTQIHLAEVFLSGLLKRVNQPLVEGEFRSTDELLYDFIVGARHELLGTVTIAETLTVQEIVHAKLSEYIEERLGQARDFMAKLHDPFHPGVIPLDELGRAFAQVRVTALRRLGGNYTRMADKLVAQLNDQGIVIEGVSTGVSQEIHVYSARPTPDGIDYYLPDLTEWIPSTRLVTIQEENPHLKQPIIKTLLTTLGCDPETFQSLPNLDNLLPLRSRIAAGIALGQIGDPRLGAMVTIPAGEFIMGSDDGRGNEKPRHTVDIPYEYQIGQYPLSNAEYGAFVDAGGYSERKYWTDAGWAWKGERTEPNEWQNERFNQPNQPVVGISWYEAVAYCNWRTEVEREQGLLDEEHVYRLPTEAEWEKAARGEDGRRYPWGDEASADHMNYGGSQINKTTPVGVYPSGVSPYGLYDCAGNVWEWCATEWKEKKYPYELENEWSVDYLKNQNTRSLRGGSWSDLGELCRSAFRIRYVPYGRSGSWGYRVVCAPVFETLTLAPRPLTPAEQVVEVMLEGEEARYKVGGVWVAAGDLANLLAEDEALREGVVAALLGVMGHAPSAIENRQSEIDYPLVSRLSAGEALGVIGDPRLGAMVAIPAGEFIMGSEDGDSDEKPRHTVDIPYEYQIGQYPLSNAEYGAFVDAGGYSERKYWTEAGWSWKGDKTEPEYWTDEKWNQPNQPVVGISWYEAVAYCNWRTEVEREQGLLDEEHVYRLPSEAEWEKAARGEDGRVYPWGEEASADHMNYNQNVGKTTPVGVYPSGVSPYGLYDCAGNVWEWCATQWKEKKYPYEIADEWSLDYIKNQNARSLRGGSWYSSEENCRSAYRGRSLPGNRHDYRGYRVVCAPVFETLTLAPRPLTPAAQDVEVMLEGEEARYKVGGVWVAAGDLANLLGEDESLREGVVAALLGVMGHAPSAIENRQSEIDYPLASRLSAGDALGVIGDPRLGSMVAIPAGEFIMGSEDGDSDEKPRHTVDIPYEYQIGQYPLSNAEYGVFVDAGGYTERKYWTEAGWSWKGEHTEPNEWQNERFNQANQPVVGISWYEAVAYCNWRTEVEREQGLLDEEHVYRLPSEAEWEKAARGEDGRRYPWGEEASPDHMNYDGSGINKTTPVGVYPSGVSPYGLYDCAGNVWEWCSTEWSSNKYPYEIVDEWSVDYLKNQNARSLRGGSWSNDEVSCRSAYRLRFSPYSRSYPWGYRVVCAPVFETLPLAPRPLTPAAQVVEVMLEGEEARYKVGGVWVAAGDLANLVSQDESLREGVVTALLGVMGHAPSAIENRQSEIDYPLASRLSAGEALGVIGDPRLGAMVTIPAGEFIMGADDITDDEKPRHTVDIPYEYQIGRYPLTNAEYGAFVDAGGYSERKYWTEAGWSWKGDKTEPEYWTDEKWNQPNQPVVGISWYEAVAYCHWRTELEREAGLIAEGYVYRLPTEAEWEKAVRGEDGRRYPWGEEASADHMNYNQNVGKTTPVGVYPSGVSPYGLYDCAGNVLEWCATEWSSNKYPYEIADEWSADYLSGDTSRSRRGGSWSLNEEIRRPAYRNRNNPYYRNYAWGYRVVCAPVFDTLTLDP